MLKAHENNHNSAFSQIRGGEKMTIEIATIATGVLIMVGAIIAGGIIYAGLEKLSNAMNNKNNHY